MSHRSQKAMVCWAIAFMLIYGIALALLLDMVPPPSAKLNAVQVAQWYALRHTRIRIGAVLASWSSAFMIPLSIVIAEQIRRLEGDSRVWTWAALIGGSMTSIFLVLPPLFWGVAAFTARHDAEVTQVMHQLGVLAFTTTTQYYIFLWIAIIVTSLRRAQVDNSPFPRWFGYLCVWSLLILECGALAYLFRSGPFAWNGLLVFWIPLPVFGALVAVLCRLLLTAISQQAAADRFQGATA